jgi:hypothetical protein
MLGAPNPAAPYPRGRKEETKGSSGLQRKIPRCPADLFPTTYVSLRTMQRNPKWQVEVSIGSGNRAAGR